MSSLLGTSRTRLITPQICHKTPPPPPPDDPNSLPPSLFGTVNWHDDDPLADAILCSTILMVLADDKLSYSGKSPDSSRYVKAKLTSTAGSSPWTLWLQLNISPSPPEDFTFAAFTINTQLPFDTQRVFWQNPINPYPHDYREARFSS